MLLFAVAGAGKLRDRSRFAAVLDSYEILPAGLIGAASRTLPIVELAVAAGLAVPATRVAAATLAGVLLLGYAAGIAVNLARGRYDLDCGCEAFGRRHTIAGWMLVRNLLLAVLAVVAAAPRTARDLGLVDALTVLAGLLALVFTYLAADEVLARNAVARRRGLHA
jgi:hypothetical protein